VFTNFRGDFRLASCTMGTPRELAAEGFVPAIRFSFTNGFEDDIFTIKRLGE
jgi:hypothetical protein